MKSKYIQFILDNSIADILSEIHELSYSQKWMILDSLLEKYPVEEINIALYIYKTNYIDLNRVRISRIKNTLITIMRKNGCNN